MKKKLYLAVLASVAALSSIGAAYMGGWAVVSVSKVPDYWVAGKPLQLTWFVRQHAVTPLFDLQPTIEATSGSRRVKGMTWQFSEEGDRGYRGRITFPEPGDWQVTINSGFMRSRAVLVPWPVLRDSANPPAPLSEAERGRRLFAAKGCVTCHVHGAVAIAGDLKDFGPNLTERKFPPDYLTKFLTDPSIKPKINDNPRMPNPMLRQIDIPPIVAFINSGSKVATR